MGLAFFLSSIFLVEIFAHQIMVDEPKWNAKKDNSTLIKYLFKNYVELKCPAHGNPKPKIKWFINNQFIDSNHNRKKYRIRRWKIKIKNVDITDNGNYTCVVENKHGRITWTYQLQLHRGPPKWSRYKGTTKTITKIPGDSAKLNCETFAFPKPKIAWFKKGELIDVSKTKYQISKGILTINWLDVSDFRNYTCVVKNKYGRLMRTYQLRIDNYRAGRPEIVGDLYRKPLIGETVTLMCFVIRPDIRPQWVKHHKVNWSMRAPHFKQYLYLLPPSPSDRQNIAVAKLVNITMEDSGLYSCMVPYYRSWTYGGWAYKAVYIEVEDTSGPGEPVFQMPRFINREAFENGRKSLNCTVTGNPQPSVKWYKDKVRISKSSNKRYNITENALIIDPVTKNDSAIFKCRVWNTAGSKSHSYTLTVIPAVPVIDGEFHTKFLVFENKSVAFGCRVHGNPRPNITWYKDRFKIPPKFNTRYKIRRDYMEIIELQKSDSAVFTCFTWNVNGNSRRIFSLLVVSESDYNDTQDLYKGCEHVTEGAPQWDSPMTKPQIISRKIGESVELECHACGIPEPSIAWYKNKNYLDPSIVTEKYRMERRDRKLKIMNLRRRDNGHYSCIAENQHGRILRLHTLKVKKNPPTLLGPVNTTAVAGTSVTLECKTENSNGISHFQWMKYYQVNGAYETLSGTPYVKIIQISALNQTDPHLLHFTNVTKDDAGSYICQVSNAGGVSSRRVWLTVVEDLVA